MGNLKSLALLGCLALSVPACHQEQKPKRIKMEELMKNVRTRFEECGFRFNHYSTRGESPFEDAREISFERIKPSSCDLQTAAKASERGGSCHLEETSFNEEGEDVGVRVKCVIPKPTTRTIH